MSWPRLVMKEFMDDRSNDCRGFTFARLIIHRLIMTLSKDLSRLVQSHELKPFYK